MRNAQVQHAHQSASFHVVHATHHGILATIASLTDSSDTDRFTKIDDPLLHESACGCSPSGTVSLSVLVFFEEERLLHVVCGLSV